MPGVDRKATVILTGGTKGLGRALALEAGSRNYHVIALYSSDGEAARELEREFKTRAYSGTCLQHDVTSGPLRPDVWAGAPARLVLIHNACAAFTPAPFHLLQWQDFDRQWQVAVKGLYEMAQSVLPGMVKQKGGTIVNVLSEAMWEPKAKGFSAYLTAKHALFGLGELLAREYRTRGIRVFFASPGFMRTDLTASWDRRLVSGLEQAPGLKTVEQTAQQIFDLVEDPQTPGNGENYRLTEPHCHGKSEHHRPDATSV